MNAVDVVRAGIGAGGTALAVSAASADVAVSILAGSLTAGFMALCIAEKLGFLDAVKSRVRRIFKRSS